jgi:hypothetical protein
MPTPEELRRLAGPKPPEPSRREIRRQEKEQRKQDRRDYETHLARQAAASEAAERQNWQDARAVADAADAKLDEAAGRHEHSAYIDVRDENQAYKVARILESQGHNVRPGSSEEPYHGGEWEIHYDTVHWVKVEW